jgi:hypothetical protein
VSEQRSKDITVRVAEGAAFLDSKIPGWATRVPLEVDITRAERSPLAYLIGKNWDEQITMASAQRLGLYTLYAAEGEKANRAWQRQVALRRPALAKVS